MIHRPRASIKPRGAFTLLELLLVLVLVAVSVATVVPSLNGTLGAWQLRESARNLQAALQLGAQWASTRQEPVAFVLDVHGGVFALRLAPEGQSANGTLLPMGRQSLGQGVSVVSAEGFTDVDQAKALVFQPGGTSQSATIVLTTGGAGSTWQINLDGRGTVHCRQKLANAKNG